MARPALFFPDSPKINLTTPHRKFLYHQLRQHRSFAHNPSTHRAFQLWSPRTPPANIDAMAPQQSAKKPVRQSPQTKIYLLLYNFNNTCLWSIVLGRALINVALGGTETVVKEMGDFVFFTQTIALLEIVHSLTGML